MDHLDIHCDFLHRLRRQTDKRFVTMTTEDIMAGMTEVLDRASYSLTETRDHPKPPSPDLIRCQMAEGIPEELLFSLEEDGAMTNDDSPASSCDSSTLTASSAQTSSETLVAAGDLEEWDPEGCDLETLSPPMDCERVPGEGPHRMGESGGERGAEEQQTPGGTWRDAICFRQYHRLGHPKMSWRRAHESVKRRRLLTSRRRPGRGRQAWSPRLNVSWTSIEEEIKKGGLLSSPVKLTALITSPVRVPASVIKINEERAAKETAKGPVKSDAKTIDVKKAQDSRKGKEALAKTDRKDELGSQDKQSKKMVMGKRRTQASTVASNSPSIPAALRAGGKRNTNHGNNTAKQTEKNGRAGGALAKESVSEADAKLKSVMEQYITAQPFVPKVKLPKNTEPARGGETDTTTTKNGAKDKRIQNVAPSKSDASSKNKRKGEANVQLKPTQENVDKKERLETASKQSSTHTKTFQSAQLPIPVIEQGVVHHRHPSPPTVQQTKEGASRPNTEPTVTGEKSKTDKPSDIQTEEPPRGHTGQQQQLQQKVNVPPLVPEKAIAGTEAGRGRGVVGPPGILGPAPWNQNPSVAMPFLPRHPGVKFPVQIPFINMPHPVWPANRPAYPTSQLPQQQHQIQGLPNHVQQPFPNGRQLQEQMLSMMHPPQQPFANRHQQEQMQMMQLPQPFVNGRQQEQMPMMQPQQPFVNGHLQGQVPMMQQAAHGQPRPIILLEDPCILFAQRNNFQQNGQNNNPKSGYQSHQQEPTNPPQLHQQNQLSHQGQPYQRSQRPPLPQGQFQQMNNSNHQNFNAKHGNNCSNINSMQQPRQ